MINMWLNARMQEKIRSLIPTCNSYGAAKPVIVSQLQFPTFRDV